MTTSNQIDWLTSLCEQVDLAWMNCYLFYRFIGAYPLYSPWNTICQKGWFWLHELASQPSKQQVEVKSPSHREITQCGVIRYIQMDGWWWIKLFCERAVGIARFFSATSMRRSFRWKTNAQQALLTPNCWEIPSIPPSFFFFTRCLSNDSICLPLSFYHLFMYRRGSNISISSKSISVFFFENLLCVVWWFWWILKWFKRNPEIVYMKIIS